MGVVVVVHGAAQSDGRPPGSLLDCVGPRLPVRNECGVTIHPSGSCWTRLDANRLLMHVGWQMCMIAVIDFLQCIQWEGQRHAWDIGVVMMVRVCGAVSHARQRTWRYV